MTGQLRGFDQFMNIVLDNTIEEVSEAERNEIGLVVRLVGFLPYAIAGAVGLVTASS